MPGRASRGRRNGDDNALLVEPKCVRAVSRLLRAEFSSARLASLADAIAACSPRLASL